YRQHLALMVTGHNRVHHLTDHLSVFEQLCTFLRCTLCIAERKAEKTLFQLAKKMHPGNHFLTGITALLEVYALQMLKVKHLGNMGFKGDGCQPGNPCGDA